jgi:hypothetical protein
MSKKILFFALFLFLTSNLALAYSAGGFTIRFWVAEKEDGGAFINVEFGLRNIDATCPEKNPCACGFLDQDYYILSFYVNESGAYYLGTFLIPPKFVRRDGQVYIFLPSYSTLGLNATRWKTYLKVYAFRGDCTNEIGNITAPYVSHFYISFPHVVAEYIAVQGDNRTKILDIYKIDEKVDRIDTLHLPSMKCNLYLYSPYLKLYCPKGILYYNITDKGLVKLKTLGNIGSTFRPVSKQKTGRVEKKFIIFQSENRTFRVPISEIKEHLWVEKEIYTLNGVFLKDSLLILPPSMRYEYCKPPINVNASVISTLYLPHPINVNLTLIETKPMDVFYYDGKHLKTIPLFRIENFKPKIFVQSFPFNKTCSISGTSKIQKTTPVPATKSKKICGVTSILILSLLVSLRRCEQ